MYSNALVPNFANSVKNIRLPPLPTVRDLVKLYKLQAIKQLSQNFLMDERLTDKIVKSAGKITQDDVVLEVGPGPGGITRSILRKNPAKLILIEKDRRFLPTLELYKECAERVGTEIEIYQADILQFSIANALPNIDQRLHLIGNLPFAISTRLLINWFEDLSLRREGFRRSDTRMTLTFQKEVADRICAPLGHEERCRLSIISQIWTEPKLKFTISGKAFVPKPEIDVGVVHLIPLKDPKTNLPFKLIEKVVRHIFSMRQKFCLRGYSSLFPDNVREEFSKNCFHNADINPETRPFQLSVDECLRLAEQYNKIVEKYSIVNDYDHRGPKNKRNLIVEVDENNS